MNRRAAIPRNADAGSVTVELAMGLVTVVGVLVAMVAVLSALVTGVRVADAARTAARLAAVGESEGVITGAVVRIVGSADATVHLTLDGDGWVSATVSSDVAVVPWSWRAESSATAWLEVP